MVGGLVEEGGLEEEEDEGGAHREGEGHHDDGPIEPAQHALLDHAGRAQRAAVLLRGTVVAGRAILAERSGEALEAGRDLAAEAGARDRALPHPRPVGRVFGHRGGRPEAWLRATAGAGAGDGAGASAGAGAGDGAGAGAGAGAGVDAGNDQLKLLMAAGACFGVAFSCHHISAVLVVPALCWLAAAGALTYVMMLFKDRILFLER